VFLFLPLQRLPPVTRTIRQRCVPRAAAWPRCARYALFALFWGEGGAARCGVHKLAVQRLPLPAAATTTAPNRFLLSVPAAATATATGQCHDPFCVHPRSGGDHCGEQCGRGYSDLWRSCYGPPCASHGL